MGSAIVTPDNLVSQRRRFLAAARRRDPLAHAALFVAVALLLCRSSAAAVVYVNQNAPGPAHNGGSWAEAFLTVQEGVDHAASDDDVWVAAGTYVQCITMKEGVALYGGFVGTEISRDQRDFVTNETILDGGLAGTVVSFPSAITNKTRVDGFTIRNGNADIGGGISCDHASPVIANNVIRANQGADEGGGIWCDSSNAVITGNQITGNSGSTFGGGIYSYNSSLTITGNTISENTGCGICAYRSSSTIAENTIRGNSSSGIWCADTGSPVIIHNTILGNTTRGGIWCSNCSASITNNVIAETRPPLKEEAVYTVVDCSSSRSSPTTSLWATMPTLGLAGESSATSTRRPPS
jgi:parallel beta-helix repeat protein